MPSLEQMYKDYEILVAAGKNISSHEDVYAEILSATKIGDQSEKRLASQFINQFYKFFPDLMDEAINAQFDLCEDDDHMIRKQAIKNLPPMCKETPEVISQVANVLSQLVQSDDKLDVALIFNGLICLRDIDFTTTLDGIFMTLIDVHCSDVIRERNIKFLSERYIGTAPEIVKDQKVQDLIVEKFQLVMAEVGNNEFNIIMKLLIGLPCMQSMNGRGKMIELIYDQAEIEYPFDTKNYEAVDNILKCIKASTPLFSKNVTAKKFVYHLIQIVLPRIFLKDVHIRQLQKDDEILSSGFEEDIYIDSADKVDVNDPRILELLKLLCEIIDFSAEKADTELAIIIMKCIEVYLPDTPQELNNAVPNLPESFKIAKVECLLYILHEILMSIPKDEHDDIMIRMTALNEMKLTYFVRCSNWFAKQVSMGKAETDEINVHDIASNIAAITRDIFLDKMPSKYHINLSFTIKKVRDQKRRSKGSMYGSPKKSKDLYIPPGMMEDRPTNGGGDGKKIIPRIVF